MENVRLITQSIPPLNRKIIYFIMQFLRKVADQKEKNSMDEKNLGMIFGATLMRPVGDDPLALLNKMPQNIIEFTLNHLEELFTEEDKNFSLQSSEAEIKEAPNNPEN